jgi:MoaA/NifB/PqqE/SkfB family radical SAM enzyme
MTRRKGFLTEELFQLIRNECHYWNSAIRFIRWGEPFLHRDIFKFIAMCRERTGYVIPTHVTTNGLLVDEETAEGILQSGLDSIIFSFQGVDVEGYMEMRNASLETTAKVYENLRRLVKMRGDYRCGRVY